MLLLKPSHLSSCVFKPFNFLILITNFQVDAKLNVISSCNYDGSKRSVILYSADYLRHPFSITTFEDYVYWTDWDKEAVFKANKFTGKDVEPVTAMHMVIFGVRSVSHQLANSRSICCPPSIQRSCNTR